MYESAIILLIAVSPFLESRAAIPLGVAMGMNPVLLFIFVSVANVLIIPIIFYILEKLFHIPFLQKFADKAHKKANKYLERYGYIGLALFVAVPLPGTGAYSGSLVAHLLKMGKKRAMFAISLGVVAASAMITLASVGALTAINTFILA